MGVASNASNGPTVLVVAESRVAAELDRQVEVGRRNLAALKRSPPRGAEDLTTASEMRWHRWRRMSEQILATSFSTNDPLEWLKDLRPVHRDHDLAVRERAFALPSDIEREVDYLEDLRGRLSIYVAAREEGVATKPGDVFLVHGRDKRARTQVKKFIAEVTGTEPVVLAEQAERGRVVIEKLEQEAAGARYAVVLMTGDDEGQLRDSGEMTARARQNVVLEAGWFMGKLGRTNVAVLVGPGVEQPSDISGMILIPFGPGSKWKEYLMRELRSAGFRTRR
jgi:hypothetical protein